MRENNLKYVIGRNLRTKYFSTICHNYKEIKAKRSICNFW